jgi:glyoxalase/bleomycin resistance protein/dioxygenase superfamily protein/predicted nucleotide modification protein, DUF1599 family
MEPNVAELLKASRLVMQPGEADLNLAERLQMANQLGVKTQGAYELTLCELATLRLEKVAQYGEDRYDEQDEKFGKIMLFSDIYRKYIRLKKMIVEGGSAIITESLRDTFLDMANYCLMGVQLLDKWAGQKMRPDTAARLWMLPSIASGDAMKTVGALLGGLKIEQVAIISDNPDKLKKQLSALGLTEWSTDEVIAEGVIDGVTDSNRAILNFNYQLGPFEFEILSYKEGKNWLENRRRVNGLSHLGVHVENMHEARERMVQAGYSVVQEVLTRRHTNPKIRDSRRYHYVIFGTAEKLGFDLKLIQRLSVETADACYISGTGRGRVER